MKISFIIPYYNEPVWMLRECLDSILALDIADDEREIIVVDDGSDVSPISQLQSVGDRIIYVRQENGGPGAARNHGMEIATGNYIQFVDSDDHLLPEYKKCLDIIASDCPDIIMFHATKTPFYLISCSGIDFMLHHNLRGAACCMLFKKAILGNLRYDTQLINEDELFNAQLTLQAATITDVGLQLYYYRQRPESRSHSSDNARISHRLDDAAEIIFRLNNICNTMEGNHMLALRRRISQLTMDYIYNIATLTRSFSELRQRVSILREQKLFPLPLRHYTSKYLCFAIISRIL